MSQVETPEAPAEQAEEPRQLQLALVYGEALTELPLDLYIPPDALEVILEAFEGPLDLLLYLIRKQNIDILDIPVAEITRQDQAHAHQRLAQFGQQRQGDGMVRHAQADGRRFSCSSRRGTSRVPLRMKV